VSNRAALVLDDGVHVGAEPLAIEGTGPTGLARCRGSTDPTRGRPVTLTGNATVGVSAGQELNLAGAIIGTGDLTKIDTGTCSSPVGCQHLQRPDPGQCRVLLLNKTGVNRAGPGPLEIGDGVGGIDADVVRLRAVTQIANTSDVTLNIAGLLDLNRLW